MLRSTVAGYPTVYWYPAGDKRNPEVVDVRDEKGLRRFISSRATNFDGVKTEL